MPKLGQKCVPRHFDLWQRLMHYSAEAPSGCILWSARKTESGYGMMFWKGKSRRVHRLAWVAKHGPIPPQMCICHRCDVPLCINPDHLFLGTQAENSADRNAKGRQAKGGTLRFATKRAILTPDQVAEIRSARETHVSLAARFGVTPSAIGRLRRGETWRGV